MNILLVEDEQAVADFLRRGLKAEGWVVTHAGDGESALDLLASESFDVVVLDLMLPGIQGQDVCRKLRARRNYTPVLMLTALDAVDERIAGLELGADDYLAKPFDFEELVARIAALHRRERRYRPTDRAQDGDTIDHSGLSFDPRALTVTLDDVPVDLTARERDLVSLFLANQGRVLSRERILNAVWGANEDPLTNVVDVYVGRLRRKLGTWGAAIQTVRGVGYRIPQDR